MEKDAAVLGKPFLIMERIRGQSFEAFFNQAAPSDKPALFRLVVDLFARLHDLDWRPFWEALAATGRQGAPEPDTQSLMEAELAGYSKLVADLDEKEYGPLIGWLVRQLPSVNPAEPSLIHLDFHTRNILMTQDAKPYVIDWTGAMVSDYRFDVAWSLIFVDPTMQDDFLSMYRSLSGRDLKDLDYFRALAWSRRVMSIMISIRYGAERLGMRPGAENVMRRNPRHIESVYRNLLNATGLRLPDVERLLEELNRPV
jgi:aminoglycoside phosphotransferase (APT) family kinase protein